jgi:hypothetical protein
MKCWPLSILCGLGLALPASAGAVGGPVQPVQGGTSVAVPGGRFHYAAFGAGRGTVIRRFTADGALTSGLIRVAGRYVIPGADFSGTTTGLSADGHTLVLGPLWAIRLPLWTRLVVLDAPRLTIRSTVGLPGAWTVDAISPRGRWLYLIHYLRADGSRYEVRAYDLIRHRLVARPVVDPREPGEKMTGFPVARVVSAGGRWAYTLYGRPQGAPFVHALDTVGRRAVCIDVPSLSASDLGEAQLVLARGGTALSVESGGAVRARIDMRTFSVAPSMGLSEIFAGLATLEAAVRISFT